MKPLNPLMSNKSAMHETSISIDVMYATFGSGLNLGHPKVILAV